MCKPRTIGHSLTQRQSFDPSACYVCGMMEWNLTDGLQGDTIACDHVVDATGAWSGVLGQAAFGMPPLPLAPVRSHYWTTGSMPEWLATEAPMVILPQVRGCVCLRVRVLFVSVCAYVFTFVCLLVRVCVCERESVSIGGLFAAWYSPL